MCHRLQYIYYQTSLRVICGNLSKRSRSAVREYCDNTSYRAVVSCVGVYVSILRIGRTYLFVQIFDVFQFDDGGCDGQP